jgi:hypothetical protein
MIWSAEQQTWNWTNELEQVVDEIGLQYSTDVEVSEPTGHLILNGMSLYADRFESIRRLIRD